jgi:Na+/H+-dicarboxylate symporter
MTSSTKILVGLVSGVIVGLFFGEHAAVLKVVADGFVKLLQMMVLPYITISIITSLGTLRYDQLKTLGLRAGAVLLGLWCFALTFTFLIPLAFPDIETATFFSSTLVERRPPFDFVDLFIPSNPFHSLANNIVPAVVLFSVFLGVALVGVERKQVLLDVFTVAKEALASATKFVVGLTPYGIFAIAANTAGTLNIEQVARIQVYVITYVAVALLVALWVLPGLVSALTPFRYSEVLGPTRDALITAFMTADLFIVLPILIQACKELLDRHRLVDETTRALPDVIVPTSFNFPHTGKLLSISFILFAGWFADAAVPVTEYPRLALAGLLTFFGSLNAAVPFLLDLFRIPADTFQLFLATAVINSRFGALLAAVHTVAVALAAPPSWVVCASIRPGCSDMLSSR